jgi:hypothetical protein
MIYISQIDIHKSYQDFILGCFHNSPIKDAWHGTNILRVKDGKERLNDKGVWEYYQTPPVVDESNYKAIMVLANYIKSFVSNDENYQYLHYVDITQYPQGISKPFHFDVARYTTTGSSITYLNDDYIGGQTVIKGISVQPLLGRTVYFNGKDINHCVMDVVKGDRYTLSMWYGKEPAEEIQWNIN